MRSASRNRAAVGLLTSSAMRARNSGSRIGLAVAAALAGVAMPRGPALAAAPADASASAGLQEVVVTARKLQENLQDVPMSIDVFTQQDMQNLAINGMDDYLQKVPSISYHQHRPGDAAVRHARCVRRQQPQLREHLLDRVLCR